MSKNKIALILLFFLAIVPIAYSADDQYKPYLHKPSVPEGPKAKLYGKYTTNLFPGAATYSYPIEVPKGTNNLQPSLSIAYNSQAVKQRPSFLGAGWALTQNYIYRDVNFTPSNTTDDQFKLILNGASYDLVYDTSDGFYHTETETFSRIQNLSNTSNTYNMYWLVTLKDGTQLRFGYNSDSELTSNVDYNYSLKWSLDQIEDIHNNKISYSYNENPYAQDNGSVYLSQILYNNDQKRKIEFAYETSNRSDERKVYEQGNVLEESRRLSDIKIYFNDFLVRRYNFEYLNLNNESSLSSLYKIRYIGSDNTSILHSVTFGYYQSTSYYHNSTTYNVSELFSNSAGTDLGLRLIDLNNDGYIDIIKGSGTSNRKAWVNNKTAWNETSAFAPPEDFTDGSNNDKGLRIADLNNDGFADLVQGWGGVRKAWLNNITKWGNEDSITWAPPSADFEFATAAGVDMGTQLFDFNGDGRVDLLRAQSGQTKRAALNTDGGWKIVSSQWESPTDFVDSSGNDLGVRLADVNGDGLVDMLKGKDSSKDAWLNNGSGWVSSSVWNPPDVFTSSSKVDNGLRLLDLNGDGLTDIVQDFNATLNGRNAYINNGNGWSNSSTWTSPESFTLNGKNIGRRIGDINGDGFGDIIIGYNDGSDIKRTAVRNSTIPYLLKNITNEFGGLTYLYYSKSTIYNNTGNDSLSDIGFNIWVVKEVTQNNSMPVDFNVLSNMSYHYLGGLYDYDDAEFRGFNIVNETLPDNSSILHYFLQNKQLKGKEYKTEVYDKNQNIFSKTENNFNFTATNYSYFIPNLLSSANYQYDGQLNNPKITNASYSYDNYGNVLNKIQYGGTSINGDEKYENYSYAVNTSSWILDKVTWYLLFDSNYNKIRETKNYYDNHQYGDPPSKGELTKIEQWLDTGGGNPTTSFKYDDFGNLYKQTDALGRTTTWEYGIRDDTNTHPDRVTNPLGHATDYTYDVGTGNVLFYTKNGITTSYQYDTFGRITKDIDPYDSSDFPTKSYTYNFDGIAPENILVKQRTTSNNTIDTYYFYDGFANLVQIKSPADYGQQVVKNLFYDGLNRVSSEQNPFFDNSNINLSTLTNASNRTKYNYDVLSRVTSVINPDGTTKNTTFNRSIIDDYDENQNRHTYILDSYGRIIAVREYNTDYYILDNQIFNTTYSYDGDDELLGIRDNYGNNFNFTYDSLGRKIQLKDPDLGTWQYSYDLIGNLISQTGGGGNLITGDSLYREYNGLGQLIRVRDGNNSNGNILEEYFYDSNGDRIKVNRYSYNGGPNETIYTPYKEWMQVKNSSGTFNFYYIYQDGVLVSRLNPDGTKYYYHNDHLGSTSLITDQNGNVVESEFYSPFGESLTQNNAEKNKLYTGQFKDTTGMYYFGARYYLVNPPIFISGDPIIQQVYDPQFLNHYAYSRNNPYKLFDIDGREVYVFLKDTNFPPISWDGVNLGLNTGHIEFVTRDPDLGGYRSYANTGIKTSLNDYIAEPLSFFGLFNSGYKTIPEDHSSPGVSKEQAFPKDYVDSFRIETSPEQERQIIKEANEIVANPTTYWPRSYNSQDLVINSLGAGDIDIERKLFPKKTYIRAKNKFASDQENFNLNTEKTSEKKKINTPGNLGGGGGRGSNVVPDPSGRKDRRGNPIYVPR